MRGDRHEHDHKRNNTDMATGLLAGGGGGGGGGGGARTHIRQSTPIITTCDLARGQDHIHAPSAGFCVRVVMGGAQGRGGQGNGV
jgi:hypothetical protein